MKVVSVDLWADGCLSAPASGTGVDPLYKILLHVTASLRGKGAPELTKTRFLPLRQEGGSSRPSGAEVRVQHSKHTPDEGSSNSELNMIIFLFCPYFFSSAPHTHTVFSCGAHCFWVHTEGSIVHKPPVS